MEISQSTEFCYQLQSKQNKQKKYIFNFYFSNLWKKFSKFVSAGISCSNESLDLFRQTARILVYLILNEIHSELIRIQSRKSKQDFFSWKIDFQMHWLTIDDFHAVTRRWKFSSSHQNRNNSTYLGFTKNGLVRRKSGLHAVNFTTNRCSRRRCTLFQKFLMVSK